MVEGAPELCAVDGCDRPAAPRSGLCWGHIKARRRNPEDFSRPLRSYRSGWDRVLQAALAYADAEGDEQAKRADERLRTAIRDWMGRRSPSAG